jgi:hypothetical protein
MNEDKSDSHDECEENQKHQHVDKGVGDVPVDNEDEEGIRDKESNTSEAKNTSRLLFLY